MARKSPFNKLQETVVGTVKGAITHPVESAEKAVEQAKGTISLGKMVAGQVTRTAADVVTSRLGHRGGTPSARVRPTDEPLRAVPDAPSRPSRPESPAAKRGTTTPTKPPVTDVATDLVKAQAAQQPSRAAASEPPTSIDAAADPAHVDATPADVAKKATAKKTTATKATAKKTTATKATAKKTTATKATAKKTATKKATAKKAASSPSAKLPVRKSAPATGADKT